MQAKTVLIKLIIAITALLFVVFSTIFIILLRKGYHYITDTTSCPDWVAMSALGQWACAIVAIIIPVVVIFISRRIEEKVEKAGNQASQAIKRNPPQNIYPFATEYSSSQSNGTVSFDYSNNNGLYSIGEKEWMFEIKFSKASDKQIYIYNDPLSILTVALVKDLTEICKINDATKYDSSSRTRCPSKNQIVVLQNKYNFYAAIKILEIKDDSRGAVDDKVTFEYVIQTNGSPNFTS